MVSEYFASAVRWQPELLELRDQLEPGYPKVRIESSDGWYRVLVGRFEKEKKAREVEQRLRREGREVLLRTEFGS